MIEIKFTDIIGRCTLISAFDARESITGSGESNYKQMRITTQEDELLKTYIGQGANFIESKLTGILGVATTATDSISFNLMSTDRGAGESTIKRSISETIVAYTLQRWYEDKSPDKSKAYNALFTDMLEATKAIAYRKTHPTLTT